MENFNNLITLGQKQDRGTLTAAEWNSLVNTIINSANSCPSANKTFTVLYLNSSGNWVTSLLLMSVTDTGIVLLPGYEYKISGYLEGSILVGQTTQDTGAKTIIHLNNALINSSTGYCILYMPKSKTLIVDICANTENYLYQTNSDTSDTIHKNGCIRSNNNLNISGEGYLLLQNASGHGLKGNELTIIGRPHILFDVNHDGIHGDNIVNIEEGDFYFKNCNDAVGSSAREINLAATPPVDETGKLRGIIRVFGGNFYVEKINSGQFVFEALYSSMGVVETVVDNTTTTTYYTTDEINAADPALNIAYTLTSKIFSPFVSIQGPALTPTNICSTAMAAYSVDTTAATVTQTYTANNVTTTDEVVTAQNGVYLLDKEEATVTVTGYLQGLLVTAAGKIEIDLNRATLVPLQDSAWSSVTWTYTDANNNSITITNPEIEHSTVIYHCIDSSNVTIQTNKDTEASYIAGKILSNNNIKITPKGGSLLYLTNPGSTPLYAGTITIYNGGGNMYSYGSAKGLDGNEIIIGNELEDIYASDKNFSGNLYFLHNSEYDLYSRISGKNKKATIDITNDMEGVIITETLGTAKTFLIAIKKKGGFENFVADTGIIRDGVDASNSLQDFPFVGGLNSLKYTKLTPTTTLYGGEKYGKTINGELAKYFN